MFFLSTDTIKKAYSKLTSMSVSNASILHIFLILKGCGYNKTSYLPIEKLYDSGSKFCELLSYLFSPFEKAPNKNDFINPFSMSSWGVNPSEPMNKWVPSRVKNNILGGATTWRTIITQDIKTKELKFQYNYIQEIQNYTLGEKKIGLIALAIWSNRFVPFERKISLSELSKHFIEMFNLTKEEIAAFFDTENTIDIEFSNQMHDSEAIRNLIGNPEGFEDWTISKKIEDKDLNLVTSKVFNEIIMVNKNASITPEYIESILTEHQQLILSGPPGTSKSYYCNQIAKKYNEDKVIKIQFHPQYTYQQFIGGHFVEKSNVVFRKGLLIDILDTMEKNKGKYLLIIEEINRANISQVFGETIQCLDRDFETTVLLDNERRLIKLPKNLHIIATMNSSDRTIGSIDHAVRRRFWIIYCPPNPRILIDLCPSEKIVSLSDFLTKINSNLISFLKNRELTIGHSVFLDESVEKNGKYLWTFEKLENLFNLMILPMIEEFCYGDITQVRNIVGDKLCNRLHGEEFSNALKEYVLT